MKIVSSLWQHIMQHINVTSGCTYLPLGFKHRCTVRRIKTGLFGTLLVLTSILKLLAKEEGPCFEIIHRNCENVNEIFSPSLNVTILQFSKSVSKGRFICNFKILILSPQTRIFYFWLACISLISIPCMRNAWNLTNYIRGGGNGFLNS
jgi:hypothetical protein